MTINTGAAIAEEATKDVVISDPSAITNTSFNVGTVTQMTLADNVKAGDAVLIVNMAVAPANNKAFHLYRRDMNINNAGDHADVPNANFKSIYIGSFHVAPRIGEQFVSLPAVPVSKDQEFYIENDTGQSTTGTTVVKVTPWTYNAKA